MKNLFLRLQAILLILTLALTALHARAAGKTTSTKPAASSAKVAATDDDDDDDDEDDGPETPNKAETPAKPGTPEATAKNQASDDDDQDDDDDDEDEDNGIDSLDITTADPTVIVGNVELASDYVLRGFTQTQHRAALQGGFDWAHPSGFSLGVWGSNVSFPDSVADLETDWMAGYQYQLSKTSYLKLGFMYYTYEYDQVRNSTDEYLKYGNGQFAFEVDYSPNFQDQGQTWYFLGSWSQPLPYDFGSRVEIGYASVAGNSAESYPDARISIDHDLLGVNLEAAAILAKQQVINGAESGSLVIFTMSQSF